MKLLNYTPILITRPGFPKAGFPKAGFPKAGLPKAGVPKEGLPKAGLPRADLSRESLPPVGLARAGLPMLWMRCRNVSGNSGNHLNFTPVCYSCYASRHAF